MTSRPARAAPLYLDFAASTLPAEEVVEAMLPWLRDHHANPHADHWHGQRAAQAIEEARESVAVLIGGDPEGVIFTSGATEANNLALKGLLRTGRSRLWLSGIEHKSLLEPARVLARDGVEVTMLDVDRQGQILASKLQDQLAGDNRPGLLAIGHGNNEIGTMQDIAELAKIAHARGHLLHVDASQTAGHYPLAAISDELDLICLSSHKMYGPAGIGALYVDPLLLNELSPQLHGGGQERGMRSGTVAPFLAVGFGAAARLAHRDATKHRQHLGMLMQVFLEQLEASGIQFSVLGHPKLRLPGHLSLQFPGVSADDVLTRLLPSLSAATGAACQSGELRASHALRALGLSEVEAGQVIRTSFGRSSLLHEANEAAALLVEAIRGATAVEAYTAA